MFDMSDAGADLIQKIPIMREPDLAADIFRTIDVGNVVRERHFERVAAILVKLNLIC